MTPRICIECGAPGEPLPRKQGRPPKGDTPRSVRREIRLEPTDAAALDALRKPGETRNDADLRVLRAALKSEGLKRYRYARSSGALSPDGICADCGATDVPFEGHHTDYMRPLDVVWLCKPCHIDRHRWQHPGGTSSADGSIGGDDVLDWPAIVFPSGAPADRVARSKYRLGQIPSGRKMLEWAKAHGLRFVVDADGFRCERVHD